MRMRVPARAAVAESVDLARAAAKHSSGLVNAVLRRLAREGPQAPADEKADPLAWLTTAGSLPRWLAEGWLERLGAEVALARARAFLERPPVVLRLNPRVPDARSRAEAAGIDLRPLVVPGAWEARGAPIAPLAVEGIVYVQDQGSQLVAHLAASPGIVLDACAAPGGKATLMADLGGAETQVIAAEVSLSRVRSLSRLVRRWGSSNVAVVAADAVHPPFRGGFDAVTGPFKRILDVGCATGSAISIA
jgi:16S rRNA (cytosine967-C5)-methyltransferase